MGLTLYDKQENVLASDGSRDLKSERFKIDVADDERIVGVQSMVRRNQVLVHYDI